MLIRQMVPSTDHLMTPFSSAGNGTGKFLLSATTLGYEKNVAEAVRVWQTTGVPSLPCRAVFVQKPTDLKRLYVLYADEKFYVDKPILIEPFGSFGEQADDPVNDALFVRIAMSLSEGAYTAETLPAT